METRPAVIDLNFAVDYRRQGWRCTKNQAVASRLFKDG